MLFEKRTSALSVMFFRFNFNKPGTAKVGAISKAQNCKRGTLWALWNSSWLQNFKKWRGTLWKHKKKFKIEIFDQCHSAENCKRGDPLGFFDIHCVAKYKKIEGETLWWNPKSFKKRRIVPKKIRVKNTKGGILCYRGSGRRCFCFGPGSGVSSSSCFGGP